MKAREHLLSTETFIPRPRPEVFDFFADAANLERITPPELSFSIRTPLPIEMKPGAVIEYRLGLFGFRFGWRTVISAWEPHHHFVDEQVAGPYAVWHHTHRFEDAPGGTRVLDEVRYQLPLQPLGEIAHPLIRRQLERIFRFRASRLAELLGPAAPPG